MKGKWPRRIAVGCAVLVVGLLISWIAIHRIPWLGPLLADTGRAVVGPKAVGALEDFAYGIDDRWQLFWRSNEEPTAYWEVPTAKSGSSRRPLLASSSAIAHRPHFPPAKVGAIHQSMKAHGDGVWLPMVPHGSPSGPAVMAKTLLHPDSTRPWSAVAIVAIDLEGVELHLKAGEYVPEATEPHAKDIERPGLVPVEDRDALLAAFNGGFKTIHGNLGMHADGVTLIRPKSFACTIARFNDGTVKIGTWTELMSLATDMVWFRQTPRCLVEEGQRAEGLDNPHLADWGSGVSGGTIIRRSAVGISPDGKTLFYGLGESTSAAHIALALTHAGATTVAQLDVNGTLPKFLTYERDAPQGKPMPRGLIDTLTFTRDEYVREPAPRDFFYVTHRGASSI